MLRAGEQDKKYFYARMAQGAWDVLILIREISSPGTPGKKAGTANIS